MLEKLTSSSSRRKLVFLGVMLLLSVIFYKDNITSPPTHLHAWTQTDRLCLTEGYLDNGFDFFHPQTYKLDPQYPAYQELTVKEGITSVDFPIHEYAIAVIMRFFDYEQPVIFRLYMLCLSLVGLYFLSALTERFTGSWWVGLLLSVFLFCAPVYNYFQAGFIPSVPSFALTLIGLFFYFKFRTEREQKHLLIAICLLTLAALGRTPFIIYLAATGALQIFDYIKSRKIEWVELLFFAIAFSCLTGYNMYNNHLGETYGSIFPGHPMPARSFEMFRMLLASAFENWSMHYFTTTHYVVFNVAAVTVLFFFLARKRLSTASKELLGFILISMVGSLIYFTLMISQFVNHDYYIIDTFYPVLVLFLIFAGSLISWNKVKWQLSLPMGLVLSLLLVIQGKSAIAERYQDVPWDKIQHTINNFEGSDQLLSSLGIGKDKSVLVINAFSPNIPLYYMKRPGFTVINPKPEVLESVILDYEVDYVIAQDEYFLSDVVTNFPHVIRHLKYIGGNENISVYERLYPGRSISLVDFYKEKKRDQPTFTSKVDFDQAYPENWSEFNEITESDAYSGRKACYINEKTEWGGKYQTSLSNLGVENPSALVFDGAFMSKVDITKSCIVVSLHENIHGDYEQYHFEAYKINKQLDGPYEWKQIYKLFYLPPKRHSSDLLKVYIWNPSGNSFYYDDLSFLIY